MINIRGNLSDQVSHLLVIISTLTKWVLLNVLLNNLGCWYLNLYCEKIAHSDLTPYSEVTFYRSLNFFIRIRWFFVFVFVFSENSLFPLCYFIFILFLVQTCVFHVCLQCRMLTQHAKCWLNSQMWLNIVESHLAVLLHQHQIKCIFIFIVSFNKSTDLFIEFVM